MNRPTQEQYFMNIAEVVASRGECCRRKVGAVIVDKRGRILSTGMNGLAPGRVSCLEQPCLGSFCASGEGLDLCESSHAEISALVTLEHPFEAHTLYSTTEPCISCTKAILLTSIERVIFSAPYTKQSGFDLWSKSRRPEMWRPYENAI